MQAKILAYLNKVPNLYYMKAIVSNKRGIPDINLCYKGRYVALEVKRVGEEATPLQQYNLERVRKAGGIGEVVYSLEQVKEIILSM